MPTYRYQCEGEHGHVFETVQSIKDEPLKDCPECAANVKRVIGTPGVLWKQGAPTPKFSGRRR